MKKCSSLKHNENDAISFCQECSICMCNKCENLHSELFQNHHIFKLDKYTDIADIFTGFCKEKNHQVELKYFCKTHNILCCAECTTKIKKNYSGQHHDCDICLIEDVENDKKNKLKENIKILEDLSINLQTIINDSKTVFEKVDKNKEELKMNIQKIFTKLRNTLNDREDELLLKIDKKYNELYLNEEIIKEIDKFPNKIKISLEKGKEIENNWNNNKLNSLINDCLNNENNIKNINKIKESISKNNSLKFEFTFIPKEDGINQFLENIKKFGNIKDNSIKIFDSKIEFDEELIKKWLNNREFNSELLYRKTRDGSTPNDFHNKCDNKGITITFIETTKGYKFGGYTELQWDKSGGKTDKSTFIFSINKNQKFTSRNNNNSIYCHSSEGPRFGCGFPEIYLDGTLDKGRSWDHSYCTFTQGRILTNGEEYWDVKELEVFKINYI